MKQYKPNTPGTRAMQVLEKTDLTKKAPERSLLAKKDNWAGRNSSGKVTVRFRGGGVKRKYRIIDFKGLVQNAKGVIKSVEYDPNRSANICLVQWTNGQKTYVLQAQQMVEGYEVEYGKDAEVKIGNRLFLIDIPTGVKIYNIEINIGKGGQIVRSAGGSAILMAKSDQYATIKLPSGEIRLVNLKCQANIGEVSNPEHRNIQLGKAGKKRYLGFRPHVRGSVMNACDHPHGGGEGKAPVGHAGPRTPWGKPSLGFKTRDRKNKTSKFIVRGRKRTND
jgi:large subunit ribosomal protein L2